MTPTTPEPSALASSLPVALDPRAVAARRTWLQKEPIYYGWIQCVIASIAMTATLPSRTHGLGIVTEPLLRDLHLSRTLFTTINAVSCVVGALFCLPVGQLIDRHGVRLVLTCVSILFGLSVLGMAVVTGPFTLLIALIFIRGFGQCALSIVSISIVGKWFNRRMGLAMGVYTILMSIGFIITIVGTGELTEILGWRTVWNGCGLFLLYFMAPCGWLLVRNSPEASGIDGDEILTETASTNAASVDYSWQEALRTPAFWVFACGTSMFNFVWSANTLLNESILRELHFTKEVSTQSLALLVPGGLIANFVCGARLRRHNLGTILGLGLLLLSINLAVFPQIKSLWHLHLYSVVTGSIGGIVTVAHFAAWRSLYGASHLGRIQGPAQLLSVLFSAAGPLFAARCEALTGSYRPGFYMMSATVGALALAVLLVPIPTEKQSGKLSEKQTLKDPA